MWKWVLQAAIQFQSYLNSCVRIESINDLASPSVSRCQLSKHQGDSRGQYLVFIQLLRGVCKDNRSLSVLIWSGLLDTALHDLSVITDPPRVSPCAARMSSVSSVSDQTRSRISLTQISDPEVGLSPHRTEPPSPPLLSSVRWAHISGVTTLAPRLSCHCDTWGGGGGVLKNGQTNSWKHVLLSSLCLPSQAPWILTHYKSPMSIIILAEKIFIVNLTSLRINMIENLLRSAKYVLLCI